jgi:quercetin dioxygenase-like cupin family protein
MMAIPHAAPGEVIDVGPLGSDLESTHTKTLIKTNDLEVIRLVLPKGKSIATHSAPGEITVHCIEGKATLATAGKSAALSPGTMLYLSSGEPHSVAAAENSTLLVTIVLPPRGK